ncbi:MAG: rod shape-determining protein RodA [Candidatus Hydrothermales bacterium]
MKNILKVYNRVLIIYLLISFLGILNIFSISRSFGGHLFLRHLVYFILGFSLLIFFSKINLPKWREFYYLFFLISIFLLVLVLVKEEGIKRWLRIGNFSFQVSDAVKPFLIYFYSLNCSLIKKRDYFESFKMFFLYLIPFSLVLVEPDLGSAFFYIFLFGVYIFVLNFSVGVKLFYIFSSLSIISSLNFISFFIFSTLSLLLVFFIKSFKAFDRILLSIAILLPGLTVPFVYNNLLKEYQRKRLKYFLNPAEDPKGAGWQVLQGKLAIGSGGILGKGFLKGSHKSLAFLPQAYSDFAFASFAEEFGFLGSLFLILLYFFLLSSILNLSKEKEGFEAFFVLGTFSSIFYAFFVNIGGVLGLLPLTGIPLTFFSYGGTNFIINSILLGISLSFTRKSY